MTIPKSHYDSTALKTINYAIEKNGYKSYLELGCRADATFKDIKCDIKVGVDIARGGTLRMSTDEYFKKYNDKFDIIFVDACHKHDYVMRDVENSLKCLNENGLIIMHDCNPYEKKYERTDGGASGTVWRAVVHLRARKDINLVVTNYDHGVGILRVEKNEDPLTDLKDMKDLTYDDLDQNREKYLKLIDWEEAKKRLCVVSLAAKATDSNTG